MKTKKKALLTVLCAVMLVVGSVFGTYAYLTDTTDPVTNTFAIGKVQITLDETKVDEMGVVDTSASARVTKNSYKLLPGHEYTKDPTVHFQPESEKSVLFVKVKNEITAIESTASGYQSVAAQIGANGWVELTGADVTSEANTKVYYKLVPANTDPTKAKDYPVFSGFTVDKGVIGNKPDTGATTNVNYLEDYNGKTIVVTAYAIQADTIVTGTDITPTEAATAWDQVKG